ncbi:MAG TPA: HEAT repeat domain-containing protein, partial [Armatimonadota bacterium]|nr:HEAT repeat domain-containing protein [Armatimonadota bacterium]
MTLPDEMRWIDAGTLRRLERASPDAFAAFWARFSPLVEILRRTEPGATRESWALFALLHGEQADDLLGFLINQLRHRHGAVRVAAAEALGRLGDSRAVRPLVARLRDRPEAMRLAAITALAALRDVTALPGLRAALADRVAPVRLAAAETCMRLG